MGLLFCIFGPGLVVSYRAGHPCCVRYQPGHRGLAPPAIRWRYPEQRLGLNWGPMGKQNSGSTTVKRGCGSWRDQTSSGSRAFDDYRVETLRRLEDEQREFKEFLERLRGAKDRAELDQFLNERRSTPGPDSSQS
jgi:Protein of unknown function (DUF2852)